MRACRWRLWREKCQDDSETRNWLTAHTKPCPKCGKPVEKNGGCNLVMCHCRQVGVAVLSVSILLTTAAAPSHQVEVPSPPFRQDGGSTASNQAGTCSRVGVRRVLHHLPCRRLVWNPTQCNPAQSLRNPKAFQPENPSLFR